MTLLTIEESAKLARCEHRIIRRAIRAGELEAMFSSRWLLDERAVLDWMRARAKARSRRTVVRRARRPSVPRDDRTASVTQLRAMQGGEG